MNKCPVTALQLCSHLLFIGRGHSIEIFDRNSNQTIDTFQIFARNKIHGLRLCGDKLLAWGGRSLALLDLAKERDNTRQKKHGLEHQINDWIMACEFDSAKQIIYIQTAHNAIITASFDLVVLDLTECTERSILYSGSMLVLSDDVLVAAGTVLGGVVVWSMKTKSILNTFTNHEGSIFGVAFSPDGSMLASCSDDRSIRLWSLNDKSQSELAVGWGHGARIWALHFWRDKYVVSISEDLTARIWDLQMNQKLVLEGVHQGRNIWSSSLDQDVLVTGGADARVKVWNLQELFYRDSMRERLTLPEDSVKDVLLVAGHIVATGQDGSVYLDGEKIYNSNDTLTIIRVWSKSALLAVGTRDGTIVIFELTAQTSALIAKSQCKFKGKLSDIITFFDDDGLPHWLAQTQNPTDPFFICKVERAAEPNHQAVERHCPFIAITVKVIKNDLYIGSRHGAIAMYTFDTFEPRDIWRKVLSEDAVTSIEPFGSLLSVTSRLGHYGIVNFSEKQVVFVDKILKGTIEGQLCGNLDKNFVVYGFRNDLFYCWDLFGEYELMTEKCGGAHRGWYFELQDSKKFDFAYVKASSIVRVKGKVEEAPLSYGSHGREIRGISFSHHGVLATGAEDTTIKLSFGLKGHITLRKHVSGIQCMEWTHDGKYLLSGAAREELFVWRVTVLDKSVFAAPVAALPVSSENPDLRVMAVSTKQLGEEAYLVCTVYSDSTIKLWRFVNEQFQNIRSSRYTTWCLIGCDFVDDRIYVRATDGFMICYTLELQECWRLKIHQSGIKGIAFIQNSSNESTLCVTAGDDNALVLSEVQPRHVVLHKEENAHSAAISCLGLTDVAGETYLVSAGVDQRVQRWKILDGAIQKCSTQYTVIADVGCMAIHGDKIWIAGSGIEVLDIN